MTGAVCPWTCTPSSNALSKKLEVSIRRGGHEFSASFAGGDIKDKLKPTGTVGKRNTGTRIRFWPDKKYFDSVNISLPRLRHLLRAKAVLCPAHIPIERKHDGRW